MVLVGGDCMRVDETGFGSGEMRMTVDSKVTESSDGVPKRM